MAFENFPLGPEMFDQAFGKTWGPRLWRATFVAVLLAIFGGLAYGARTVAKAIFADLSPLSVGLPGGPVVWVTGGGLALVGAAIFFGLRLTRGTKQRVIRRDIWLQDAVVFLLEGHWPSETEIVFQKDGDVERVYKAVAKMRELAGECALFIWGKSHPNRLVELIPTNFWMENQIEGLGVCGNEAENVATESAIHTAFDRGYSGADGTEYKELKVNKAQVEALVDQLKP